MSQVGTTSMYDMFRRTLGIGEHLRCVKEVPGSSVADFDAQPILNDLTPMLKCLFISSQKNARLSCQ